MTTRRVGTGRVGTRRVGTRRVGTRRVGTRRRRVKTRGGSKSFYKSMLQKIKDEMKGGCANCSQIGGKNQKGG